MTRLYLVRHASHGLLDRALAGRMPGVHLSEQGHREAEAVAALFRARPAAALVSSPLERCRETAAPIAAALGLPVEIDAALHELDCGEWTSQPFHILRDDPRWQAWNEARGASGAPGGETTRAVQARIMGAIRRLAAAEAEPTIFVTHADVIKVAVQTLLDMPLDRYDRFDIDPASITTVDLWPEGGRIVRVNEAASP